MSTPSDPTGPIVYPPRNPYAPFPPLDASADLPPAPPQPPKRGIGAGAIVGIAGGAVAIALVAGSVGGAVGYLAAREGAGTGTTASAVVAAGSSSSSGSGSVSVVPGSIADIAARVQPAVVQLNVKGADSEGTGSGFIISQDGYIVTNNHVAGIASADGIEVSFSDGTTAKGKLIGASQDYDLALVKVSKTGLPTIPLGDSEKLMVGDSVIAVGSPLGLQGTVTTGIVSALNRPVTAGESADSTSFIDAIQTDAAINPGNSGGPLLNASGEVIGVNSAIASMGASAGSQAGSIGLGFAIPVDTVKRIVSEIQTTGSASTPVIGVSLDTSYTGQGAKVGEITAGGGAEAAGLQAGDVITKIDGQLITDPTMLVVTIRDNKPGDTVTLTVERDGTTKDIPVTLKAAPKS